MGEEIWRPSSGDLLGIGGVMIAVLTYFSAATWQIGILLSLVVVGLVIVAAFRHKSHPTLRVLVSGISLLIYFVFVGPVIWHRYIEQINIDKKPVECYDENVATKNLKDQANTIEEKMTTDRLFRLGKPLGCLSVVSDASRGQFQHGVDVLWIKSPRRFFDVFNSSWAERNENNVLDANWAQMDHVKDRLLRFRKHWPQPAGLYPPADGMAVYLDNEPEKWNTYGWERWIMKFNESLFWPFEN